MLGGCNHGMSEGAEKGPQLQLRHDTVTVQMPRLGAQRRLGTWSTYIRLMA